MPEPKEEKVEPELCKTEIDNLVECLDVINIAFYQSLEGDGGQCENRESIWQVAITDCMDELEFFFHSTAQNNDYTNFQDFYDNYHSNACTDWEYIEVNYLKTV